MQIFIYWRRIADYGEQDDAICLGPQSCIVQIFM